MSTADPPPQHLSFAGRELTPESLVWLTAGATMLIKLLLAVAIPITQDEAYFAMWGETPGLGYSEHPPMIGWMEFLILQVGRHPLLVRLPALLATLSIGLGLFWLLRDDDRTKAALVTVLYFLSPVHLLYVIVTTDSGLVFFAFWSAAFLFQAVRRESYICYTLSGLCLGAAFLSKYFSAFLLLAYVVYFLVSRKERRKTVGFLILFACAFPFGLVTLYWNFQHSWMEVRYPFYRDDEARLSLLRPLSFLVQAVYLAIPAGLVALLRHRRGLVETVRRSPVALFGLLYAVPMAALAVLSLRSSIGLHWLLSFVPFLYAITWLVLEIPELWRSLRVTALFSAVHLAPILIVLAVPLSWLEERIEPKDYATLVMGFGARDLVEAIEPYAEGARLAASGYGAAALLDFHFRDRHVAAFGRGSYHGRNDDFVTDFRRWAGDDVVVVRRRPPDLERDFSPYFESVRVEAVGVRGATFYLVMGRGFRFDRYRDEVLAEIRDRYYRVPEWLPMERCYFRDKYFDGGR